MLCGLPHGNTLFWPLRFQRSIGNTIRYFVLSQYSTPPIVSLSVQKRITQHLRSSVPVCCCQQRYLCEAATEVIHLPRFFFICWSMYCSSIQGELRDQVRLEQHDFVKGGKWKSHYLLCMFLKSCWCFVAMFSCLSCCAGKGICLSRVCRLTTKTSVPACCQRDLNRWVILSHPGARP